MIWMDVDTALAAVPVNVVAMVDDTDFKTREESVTFDQAGIDLVWNFVTTAGAYTQTAVTPTTAGVYDWTNKGNGMYSIEIPASGGASINNDTEGFGWFTGFATGILPWTGPIIGFRAAALNNALVDGVVLTSQLTVILSDTTALQVQATTIASDIVLIYSDTTAIATALATAQLDLDIITDTDGVILGAAGVDLVWDELLTGGTHNVSTSAGRRLRTLQTGGAYEGGAIWVDTVNGTAGTVDDENGVVGLPVDTWADALTLATSLGLKNFHIANGSTVTLSAASANYFLYGHEWTLALGGQSVASTMVIDAAVSGTGTGAEAEFEDCIFAITSLPAMQAYNCSFTATTSGGFTMSAAGDYRFINCQSGVAGAGAPLFTLGTGAISAEFRRWSGGITFAGITADDVLTIGGEMGTIDLGSPSGAADIQIRGTYKAITNVGSAVVNVTGAILCANVATILSDTTAIAAEVTQTHSETTALQAQATTIASDLVLVYSDTTAIEAAGGALTAAQDSKLTRVQSDVILVYSDTTAIEAGGGALTAAQSSKLTRINSDLIIVGSDVVQLYSDTTIISSDTAFIEVSVSDIESALVIAQSRLVIVKSDATAIESELIVVHSDTTAIESELIITHSETTSIESELIAVHSETTAVQLLTIIMASDILLIHSDTTIISSDTADIATEVTVVHSETTAIQAASGTAVRFDGIATVSGSTYYASFGLMINGAHVTTGLSALVCSFHDKAGTNLTFSGTPTESGGFITASGTLTTPITNNQPVMVKVGATYATVAYSRLIPAVAIA